MTELKGAVLCEKFNENFADLVLKSGNLKKVFCVRYKEERNIYPSDYMNLFKRSNVELEFFYDLTETKLGINYLFKFNAVDDSNFYTFHLSLTDDGEFYFSIDNNGIELDSYIFEFREDAFNSFFNFIQTEEENTPEPEQPEEDDEEPAEVLHLKDCGLTESEENFLELLLIEEISRLSVLSSQSSDDNTIELISEQLDTLVNIKDKLFVV